MNAIELLQVDWGLLRRLFPDRSDERLLVAAVERGRAALDGALDDDPGASADDPVSRLTSEVIHDAARVAVHRFDLVTRRDRLAWARRDERATYERHLELHKDVVPAMKLRAKELRAEVVRLEAEARARDIDVDAIEPAIDWPETISVEDYTPPRYESNEDRRRTTVEFFRRVREG
jgi:hypothetical protein